MNLIIDVGNTYVKLAVFNGSLLEYRNTVKIESVLKAIERVRHDFVSIERAIVSSVGRLNSNDVHQISNYFNLLVLNSDTDLPFTNLYETPKTLGVDRMALVSASVSQFP